jgi:FkbM family methyltransferase
MRRTEIVIRSWLRRLGVMKPLKRMLVRVRASEQDAEREVLSSTVRTGDFAWDVGANGGGYSVRIARAAGHSGRVWAFEPAPNACEVMRRRLADEGIANVEIVPVALGERTATARMQLGPAPGGRIISNPGETEVAPSQRLEAASTIDVPIVSGDEYRLGHGLPVPNFIKIDVEGFEIEVLNGLRGTLAEDRCRAALCEVHFAQLEARGLRFGPMEVERRLQDGGFVVKWIGRSHVLGVKRPT